ncbi:MAG: hypothetical protein ACRDUA_13880, partial [Micromonosporaceae bacterium]
YVTHAARRLPPGSHPVAVWGGLQDTVPRAGLLGLHARVEGTAAAPFDDVLPTQLVVRTSCGSHAGTDAPSSTGSTEGTAPLHVGRTG